MFWLVVGLLAVGVAVMIVRAVMPMHRAPTKARGSRPATYASPPTVRWPGASRSPSESKPAWYGASTTVRVHEFGINHPMTYIGSAPRTTWEHAFEPSAIDPKLRVDKPRATAVGRELPYWPSYHQLTAAQRWTYLSWLAAGRRSLPPEDGYLFIFYYGLERRALLDGQDIAPVLQEVRRLRRLHLHAAETRSQSFQRYSSSFIWFLIASAPRAITEQELEQIAGATRWWPEDTLGAALSWFAALERPLPSWMAQLLAEQMPGSQRSVVVNRVADEFRRLFAKRYRESYGEGLQLKLSKRPRVATYQPASAALSPISRRIPNPLGISSQFKPLVATWNGCIEDLRSYSRRATKESDELTAQAWEALPNELRVGIDHPLTPTVCKLVERHSSAQSCAIIGAGETALAVGVEFRERLTAKQSRDIVEAFQHVGYAIEPDARLTSRSYRWEERLAVFLRMYDQAANPVRYNAAACMLQLGLHVAQADGTVDPEELSLITTHIEEAFDLNEHECRRLEALRHLLLSEGADIAGIGRRIAAVIPEGKRGQVGRLLVAVAAVDGIITKSEIRSLRKCYRALSLKPEAVEEALAELAVDSDELPVVIEGRAPRTRRGERIPPPATKPHERARVSLDRARIAEILAETREVAVLLADAMNLTDEESTTPMPVGNETPARQIGMQSVAVAEPAPSAVLNLPGRYAAFYAELVASVRWSVEDADRLARQHGLMLRAAVERINDWSFDALGGPVLFEGPDHIEVDVELISQTQGGG